MNSHTDPDAAEILAIKRLLHDRGLGGRAMTDAEASSRSCAEKEALVAANEVWDMLGDLKDDPDYALLLGRPTWRERLARLLSLLNTGRRWRLRPYLVLGSGVVAAAVAVLAWLGYGTDGTTYATNVAEIRQLSLDDGSTIALGAKSRLEIAYSEKARVVDMQPGEAFFSVTPDPGRPFIIKAGDTRITVVGTKFNVKYDGETVRVAVAEGKVKVTPPKPLLTLKPEPALPVSAGKQAVIEPEIERIAIAALPSLPPETWLSGRLAYEDAPLKEIIADVNRYLPGQIIIASDQLAEERLTTSFRADQAAAFLESLPQVLPVSLQGKIGEHVVLRGAVPDRRQSAGH